MATSIDIKTVDEIAHLARLEFDEQSKPEILKDMNRMLGFIEKLNELDTSSVEPLIYMTNEHSIMREDEALESINQKQALQNAPKKDSDYFKAPKVIDQNR
ncbi:MAG: Asp-tRNA(Asn)/Glu-tRNA(Gln) amidotransferase subunit GatC [Bacteroidota bacterium]